MYLSLAFLPLFQLIVFNSILELFWVTALTLNRFTCLNILFTIKYMHYVLKCFFQRILSFDMDVWNFLILEAVNKRFSYAREKIFFEFIWKWRQDLNRFFKSLKIESFILIPSNLFIKKDFPFFPCYFWAFNQMLNIRFLTIF